MIEPSKLNLPPGYEAAWEETNLSNGVDHHWIVIRKGGEKVRMFNPGHGGVFGEEELQAHKERLKGLIEGVMWAEQRDVDDEEEDE